MFKRFGCVYKITNLVNGKSYIGQTVRKTKYRWNEHINYRLSRHLGNAINCYGINNFKFEEIYISFDINDLNDKEVYFINYFNSMINGYNLTSGGDNQILSEDTKEKISLSLKGKKKTEEHNKKSADARRGRKVSSEHLKIIQNVQKARRKQIKCVETGVIFNSICEASKTLSISKGNISNVLVGRRKTVNGLRFIYVN